MFHQESTSPGVRHAQCLRIARIFDTMKGSKDQKRAKQKEGAKINKRRYSNKALKSVIVCMCVQHILVVASAFVERSMSINSSSTSATMSIPFIFLLLFSILSMSLLVYTCQTFIGNPKSIKAEFLNQSTQTKNYYFVMFIIIYAIIGQMALSEIALEVTTDTFYLFIVFILIHQASGISELVVKHMKAKIMSMIWSSALILYLSIRKAVSDTATASCVTCRLIIIIIGVILLLTIIMQLIIENHLINKKMRREEKNQQSSDDELFLVKRFFIHILKNISQGIAIVDSSMHIHYANNTLLHMLVQPSTTAAATAKNEAQNYQDNSIVLPQNQGVLNQKKLLEALSSVGKNVGSEEVQKTAKKLEKSYQKRSVSIQIDRSMSDFEIKPDDCSILREPRHSLDQSQINAQLQESSFDQGENNNNPASRDSSHLNLQGPCERFEAFKHKGSQREESDEESYQELPEIRKNEGLIKIIREIFLQANVNERIGAANADIGDDGITLNAYENVELVAGRELKVKIMLFNFDEDGKESGDLDGSDLIQQEDPAKNSPAAGSAMWVAIVVIDDESQTLKMKKLEDQNEYKMRMLASVSHELRTPLNCSISMLQIMREELNAMNQSIMVKENLDPALHSSKLLLNLINDILDFAQLEAGKFKITVQQFNLQQILQECLLLVSIQAKMKKIRIGLQMGEQQKEELFPDSWMDALESGGLNQLVSQQHLSLMSQQQLSLQQLSYQYLKQKSNFDRSSTARHKTWISGEISSDPNRVRQIVLNLLSNALKFTENGQIMLRTRVVRQKPLAIEISCEDTGIGIPQDRCKTIFDSFNKADLSNRRKYNQCGAGLGLSISSQLAKVLCPEELADNPIVVESKVGKGSTFSFVISDFAAQRDDSSPVNQNKVGSIISILNCEVPFQQFGSSFGTVPLVSGTGTSAVAAAAHLVSRRSHFSKQFASIDCNEDFISSSKQEDRIVESFQVDSKFGIQAKRQSSTFLDSPTIIMPIRIPPPIMEIARNGFHEKKLKENFESSQKTCQKIVKTPSQLLINSTSILKDVLAKTSSLSDHSNKLNYMYSYSLNSRSSIIPEVNNNQNIGNLQVGTINSVGNIFVSATPSNITPRNQSYQAILSQLTPKQQPIDQMKSPTQYSKSSVLLSSLPPVIQYRSLDEFKMIQLEKKCRHAQVLVVDDNQFNILAMQKQLKKLQLDIDMAFSGEQAIEKIQSRLNLKYPNTECTCQPVYQVVFMDIDMPIMNGYEATARIQEIFKQHGIPQYQSPIVACSAYVSLEDKKAAFDSGMLDYVVKPVMLGTLDQVFTHWFVSPFEKPHQFP